MIRAGDYVLPVPLDDPRPVATCIRVARVDAGLVELEGDGAPLWREDGTRLNPAAPRGALPAPHALRGAVLPHREAHRGAAGGRLVRWLALAGLLATCATGERAAEPSCSSACYTRTSSDGPECWCMGPRPCQTAISAGACP